MLRRLLYKMLSNSRMIACLLIGFILATAMMSSIPIYTDGALQRMLTRDLENFQVLSGYFPGFYNVKTKLDHSQKKEAVKTFEALNKRITDDFYKEIGVPALSQVTIVTNDYLKMVPEDSSNIKAKSLRVEALTNIGDHIVITHGRMFSPQKQGDTYEVIATEEAVQKLDLILDKVYLASNILDEKAEPFKVKVVGVFKMKELGDPYWFNGLYSYAESLIMDYNLFTKDYMEDNKTMFTDVQWYYGLDYHKITIKNLNKIVSAIQYQQNWFRKTGGGDYRVPSIDIFKKYDERAKLLKLTLWVLQVPILLMLVFYLFMVSQLIIDQEKNEIAVLKSRGASRLQIFNGYFLESLILSGIALIIGPLVGLLLCKILGASNGFMEFVQRTSLPVSLSFTAYKYSLYAVVAFIITMLIPVIPATKTTIVAHKQKKARYLGGTYWKKYFIDIVLFAISCYGLYNYRTRQSILQTTGANTTDIPIDPLLFLISTIFILSLGLMFLRVYPYIIQFIFWIGRKKWSPTLYASLINVGRSGGKDQFLMLFLILTISIGIYNANTARTINVNNEEKEKYAVGADITLKIKWQSDEESNSGGPEQQALQITKKPVTYVEPPFEQFTKISGVDVVTKVFRTKSGIVQAGEKSAGNVYVMGIIPNEFGKIAWMRPNLLSKHWYNYLNLLAKDPRAMLVSRSFEKKYKVKVGDPIYLKWGDNDYMQGYIFQFIDYWPTYNPYEKEAGKDGRDFVAANLSYIHARMRLEPYEIWMKKAPHATSQQIYNDIKDKGVEVIELKDSSQQIVVRKNDPILQGTNGALTLGFIVTMLVSAIGFLIYWILSIQGRTLQFGIFRAMGISLKEIIKMLIWEQILVSGISIIMGIIIGGITSDLFVPLLQIVYSSADQVPPFKVVAYGGDYIKLYVIVILMLTMGFVVLGNIISRIKISQAIKLGED